MESGDDIVIPSIRIFDMVEESNKDTSKAMQTVFHLIPRITQAIVNEEASGLTGDTATITSSGSNPILGVEDETIWGRTFKIRLISRKTKRQFDINITFGQEFVESSESYKVKFTSVLDQLPPASV